MDEVRKLNEPFADLYRLIQKHYSLVEALLTLAKRHSNLLCRDDVSGLMDVAREEETLAAKIGEEEKLLKNMLDELMMALKLPFGSSLKDLSHLAPDEVRKDFTKILSALNDRLKELIAVNDINRLLTQRAARFNEKLLHAFVPDAGRTYQPSGNLRESAGRASLLNRTV